MWHLGQKLRVCQPKIRKRVDQALAQTGMTSFAKRAPATLSGGQKQRGGHRWCIGNAAAAYHLDEPTSMLDPRRPGSRHADVG